jgi:hypothetical protein
VLIAAQCAAAEAEEFQERLKRVKNAERVVQVTSVQPILWLATVGVGWTTSTPGAVVLVLVPVGPVP